jgi:hypothetical protein
MVAFHYYPVRRDLLQALVHHGLGHHTVRAPARTRRVLGIALYTVTMLQLIVSLEAFAAL